MLCEDAEQARRSRRERGDAAATPPRAHVRRPRRRSRPRARLRARSTRSALDEAGAAIDEDDLFTYIYTSGTTGPPKGCMIRHRNYYAMVAVVDDLPGLRRTTTT